MLSGGAEKDNATRREPAALAAPRAAPDEERQPAARLTDDSIRDRPAVSPAVARLLLSDKTSSGLLTAGFEHEERSSQRRRPLLLPIGKRAHELQRNGLL